MATGAAAIMLQCAFEGTISMHDMDIERKPYHRNCGCALHKLKGVCHNACSQRRNISFPKKQLWNDCSLSIEISTPSSQSSSSMTRQLIAEKMQMKLYSRDNRIPLKDRDNESEEKG